MKKNKKILVTGSTGLIGSNLVKRLKDEGHDVKGISTKDGDLQDYEFCKKITKGIDIVFHCAANTSGAKVMQSSPLDHVTPNVVMNSRLMENCYKNKVKKFIFMSSSVVYPNTYHTPNKETDNVGNEIYEKYFAVGWMKRYTEKLCELYSNYLTPSMQCIIIRPANIYGPGDKFDERSHVLPATIMKVVNKDNPINVWGDGNDIRDFIYIDDFIDSCIVVMNKVDKFDIFNIGSGNGYSVRDLLSICMRLEKHGVPVTFDSSKPSMIPVRLLDVSKSERILNFKCKTTLEEGLKKTLDWYRENVLNSKKKKKTDK